MAKVEFSPLVEHIRGKIGKLVYRHYHTGKTVVSKCPDMSGVTWSPAKKAHHQRFKETICLQNDHRQQAIEQDIGQELAVVSLSRQFFSFSGKVMIFVNCKAMLCMP